MVKSELFKLVNELDNFEDIKAVSKALNERWGRIQSKVADKFYKGQKVSWKSRKAFGETHTGVVEKVNTKTVIVKVGNVRWTVAPSLLKAED